MMQYLADATPVVSPRINAIIWSSPRLRQILLPESPLISSYEISDYDSTLILHDTDGTSATFSRRQKIRFLQNGVSAMLDHFWGDGVVTYYHNEAGTLEDSFIDHERRHLVVRFRKAMRRGETLNFAVERKSLVGFTQDEEWLETIFDQRVAVFSQAIIFPKGRPCSRATLLTDTGKILLPVFTLPDGRAIVRFHLDNLQPRVPYTLIWNW